ncbi:hypothetical protein [Mucilaginibacter myungsuensis]|uniref:Uncharacterized protein n=1 Tax=Mucilaginibacter myungsuensis TaxID=649104 RepID=A0A929PV23_9SPHI|nr:hypothetical protein [Mucilaginibacter myungsuensis]MBE9660546.1 hypothetical protein [Mucilaginibacter myungsuensis]MDN3600591.1 hypothetical protein [Mucilaginibacter myungsuensis]
MNKLLLRLARMFDPILIKAGVNTDQLHHILAVKLTMDDRRPRTLFAKKKTATSNSGNPILTILFSMLMGLVLAMILFYGEGPLSSHTFFFSIFIILLCFTIVTDFTSVLIDTRDQFIILPRPVDDRTIAVSRIAHITVYVIKWAFVLGLPAIVLAGVADKSFLSPFVMLIEVLQATFISVLIVNLVYLAMMRTMDPQRFKDLINYFQIAFSTLIFATYYLLPRLVDLKALAKINLLEHTWAYFLPSVWISAFNYVFIHPGQLTLPVIILALMALVVPMVGIWFVIKVLAPGFNQKLMALSTSDGNTSAPRSIKTYDKQDLRDKIGKMVAPDPVENAGFSISWKLAARSRDFKLKAYPSFAFVPILFLYMALSGGKGQSLDDKLTNIQSGSAYFSLLYLSSIILTSMLTNIAMSEKFKAAWIYYAVPVDKPGRILSGMFKAVLTLYYLPFYMITAIGVAVVWGPATINDAILAFFICLIYGVLVALFGVKGLPFSKPVVVKQSGGKVIASMATLILVGILGVGHYFLSKWELAIWIVIVPIAAIAWIMIVQYKKTSWMDLESLDESEAIEKPKKIKKPTKQTI